jgi:aminoglycoside/choline kinase family phosphotransferase
MAMVDREQQIEAFLTSVGWADAERRPLAADASFRRYDRLARDGASAVLMDAPPPMENVAAFHAVQQRLLALGLSAPRPLGLDSEAGFLLLEDFGDRTFTRALSEGADEAALYRLATDVLIALHRRLPGRPAELAPYDDRRLLEEALLLPDWYFEAATGQPPSAAQRDGYIEAWRTVLPLARAVPECLVLRDYHVDNLMVLEGRDGVAACGLLDFQDALAGPSTYDLVSLLEDARRDISQDIVEEMLARYLGAFPALDRAAFETSYAILGAQRSAKILGIFTRLSRRDGKADYLKHIPRVWRLLARDLSHPTLAAVKAWFDRELPPPLRQVPAHVPPGKVSA